MTRQCSAAHLRPLTAAKLYPPTLAPTQVIRQKIRDEVCTTPTAKVILIQAPAGFGKTTVMLQCRTFLAESGTDTGWVTLDRGDNDPSRFLECLSAAVGMMSEKGSNSAAGAAPRRTGSLGEIAFDIMARLAAHDAPFTLFLDDFEFVHDATVLSLMREIIDKLPRGGRLVIGSRSLPDLGLARLRVRGQLLEIDAGRLRLTMDETVAFFDRCQHVRLPQVRLPQEAVSALHRRCEGWIAALVLASVALERHENIQEFVASFSGTHVALTEYLADQVLTRQPEPIRSFLLRTSILRQLDAASCDALLSRTDSAQILRQLDAANLFLIPLEGEDCTYRYHSLFSDFLRAELLRSAPDDVPRLHGMASQWYEHGGRPVPAIDHALEAGNHSRALDLLSRHAGQLLSEGRMRLLARWFAAIPENRMADAPMLQAIHAWALCFTRGAWEAMALLERSACRDDADPKVQAYVVPLRLVLLCMLDRYEEAYDACKQTLAAGATKNAFSDSVLANVMATVLATVGRYQESLDLLETARRCLGEGASLFNVMYSETVAGIIELEEGQLRQATVRFQMAVRSTPARSYHHTHGNAYAGILYAEALYEANRLEEAANLLQVYVPVMKDIGLADHTIKGYVLLSRIACCRGETDQAFKYLGELEYLGRLRQSPRVIASAKLERSRIHLLLGDRRQSKEDLLLADNQEVWNRVKTLRLPAHDLEYFSIARIRWEIHHGDAKQALALLESELDTALRASRRRRALKLRLLQCLAWIKKGETRIALTAMAELLKETRQEGYMRLFIDEGEMAAALISQLQERMQEQGGAGCHSAFDEYLQRLLDGFGPRDAGTVQDKPAARLTRSELKILSLVACGYSNLALSESLSISHSTVRTHLRTINGKLHTQSRAQAVAMARRLHMIQ